MCSSVAAASRSGCRTSPTSRLNRRRPSGLSIWWDSSSSAIRLPLDQLGYRQRRRLPYRGEPCRTPQRAAARPADPDRRMWLLQGLGIDEHIGERKEPAGKRHLARRPAGLPKAQVLVRAGTTLVERRAEG